MFIDEVQIYLKSGDGGNGALTFRTEKHVPRGGPDGGDGGRGGSIIFETDPNISTLLDFRLGRRYLAARGGDGMGKKQYGRDGANLVLKVPPGTQIRRVEDNALIADLSQHPQREIVAAGGRGGRGNVHFTTSTQQAPKFAEKGEPGEELNVKLELKLLADVGLLGFPNVGKSTLLASTSAARPKIADYPFTTLVPNLGMVRIDEYHNYVMADIPGVIEGASEGAGLGLQFLRHLERTRLLVHLIDVSGLSGREPLEDYAVINRELARFSAELAALPQVIALSRIDVLADREPVETLKAHFEALGLTVFPISSVTREGLDPLIYHLHHRLQEIPKQLTPEPGIVRITANKPQDDDPRRFTVERDAEGVLVVSGKAIERVIAMTDMGNEVAVRRLQRMMERWGVFRKLKAVGAEEGDTVRIRDVEFDYIDEDAFDEPPIEIDDDTI